MEAKAIPSYVITDPEKSLDERVGHLGILADDAEARGDREEAAARHEDCVEAATAAAAARAGRTDRRVTKRRKRIDMTPSLFVAITLRRASSFRLRSPELTFGSIKIQYPVDAVASHAGSMDEIGFICLMGARKVSLLAGMCAS